MTSTERPTKRCVAIAALAVALAAVAAVPVASGRAERGTDTGSLAMEAALDVTSTPTACPPGAPPEASLCAAREGGGLVRGLGRVSETYMFFVDESSCAPALRVLETTVRLDVAGKGTLQFAADRGAECIPSALQAIRGFTITGGSGIYAGASGSGTVHHDAHYTFTGAAGTDTWSGTLTVSGLEFDLTPPTVSGAHNKTVRARRGVKRVRVAYKVTARDAVDGAVPAPCRPKSGSRFKVGRTLVRCSATDRSANTQTARFTIVVKARKR